MLKLRWSRWLLALEGTLAATAAWAGPVGHTALGEQVRAGLFDGHFTRNLAVTLLPFVFFAAIVTLLGAPPSPSPDARGAPGPLPPGAAAE